MASKDISENIEEYLEVLYKCGSKQSYVSTTIISKQLGIAPGSVTQMLKKLEDLDYIQYVPYKGAILTPKGSKIAQKITRKHRILERFLKDVLNIKDENVHIQACEMEHSLSDEAERALCHMLNLPDSCPDDQLIPACDFDFNNCEDCLNNTSDIEEIGVRDSNLLSITQLESNEEGEVEFIRGNNNSLSKIIAMGIAIGVKIQNGDLNSSEDPLKIIVNGSSIDIPKSLANNIFVKTF